MERLYLALSAVIFLVFLIELGKAGDPITNQIVPCQDVCKSTFQGPDRSICLRGCRFVSVLDVLEGGETSLEGIRESCLKACSEAYGTVNGSSCAFGCQSQLPAIEAKRKQLTAVSLEFDETSLFDGMSRFSDYAERMLGCMRDQFAHPMTYGWMMISASMSDGSGRVVIIRGTPVRVFQVDESFQDPQSSSSEETNLASVDTVSAWEVRRSQMKPVDPLFRDGRELVSEGYVTSDWLSCMSARTGLSKMSIVFVVFTMLIVLIWFIVGIFFPSSDSKVEDRGHQKLSIYGDMEYLTLYNEKSGGLQTKFEAVALPLPLKMQEI